MANNKGWFKDMVDKANKNPVNYLAKGEEVHRRVLFGSPGDKPAGIMNVEVGRDKLFMDEVRNLKYDPDYGVANEMDVMEAARRQIASSYGVPDRLVQQYGHSVFGQNDNAKKLLADDLNRELMIRYNKTLYDKLLYGEAYTLNGERVDPADVRGNYNRDLSPHHAMDSMRYAIHQTGKAAGKTAAQMRAMHEAMQKAEVVVNVAETVARAFRSMPLNVMTHEEFMKMSTDNFWKDAGWQNHGGEFNIIIKNKKVWREEHLIEGSAW